MWSPTDSACAWQPALCVPCHIQGAEKAFAPISEMIPQHCHCPRHVLVQILDHATCVYMHMAWGSAVIDDFASACSAG